MKTMALCAAILLCGCSTRAPLWTDATASQRARQFFRPDAAYYASPDYKLDFDRSIDAVKRLRK